MAAKSKSNGHSRILNEQVHKETRGVLGGYEQTGRGPVWAVRTFNEQSLLSRSALLRQLTGTLPELDIDAECRYPKEISPDMYQAMYERQGIATKVVSVYPDESWQLEPDIYETEDLDKETAFEKEWEEMKNNLHILTHLQTADEISGIGEFGILLLAFDDGREPEAPVAGIRADGTRDKRVSQARLVYVRPLSQAYVTILEYETNPRNPRFGQPTMYECTFSGDATPTPSDNVNVRKIDKQVKVKVHWTRVLHLADNRKDSVVIGVPRMRPVFNRILDIRKILGANAQGYWSSGFPGLSIETHPQIEAADFDKEATREEVRKFQDSQQRTLLLEGLTARPIAPNLVDPTAHYRVHLEDICITINVPTRIFKGSEEAKLASSQDMRSWTKRLTKRQLLYINPFILRAFFDRMFLVGAMTKPKTLIIKWPDLNAPTENDRATTAAKITEALVKYVIGNVSVLMQPKEYLTLVCGFPVPQVDAILKSVGADGKNLLKKMAKVAAEPPKPAAVGAGRPSPKARSKKPSAGAGAGRPD